MFTDQKMYKEQINAAITAVRNHPNTILAVILGSENLSGNGGPFSPQALIGEIQKVRGMFSAAGVKPPKVATTQRINEWLSPDPNMRALSAVVDIIGVNIYPFFTPGWNPAKPIDLLNAQVAQLSKVHPAHMHKVVISESGWPTAGSPPPGLTQNVPNVANAKAYFNGFMTWSSPILHFWFLSHDRRADDPASKMHSFEASFGRYTTTGEKKY